MESLELVTQNQEWKMAITIDWDMPEVGRYRVYKTDGQGFEVLHDDLDTEVDAKFLVEKERNNA